MNLKTEDLKILLVDDSDFSRQLIKTMLKEDGFVVSAEANSAESALGSIRENRPHVLITDIVMPNISGIELTEKVTQKYDDISVIVISSLSQEHVVLEAIGAGARDFIAKPIQKHQIVDSLNKILQEING